MTTYPVTLHKCQVLATFQTLYLDESSGDWNHSANVTLAVSEISSRGNYSLAATDAGDANPEANYTLSSGLPSGSYNRFFCSTKATAQDTSVTFTWWEDGSNETSITGLTTSTGWTEFDLAIEDGTDIGGGASTINRVGYKGIAQNNTTYLDDWIAYNQSTESGHENTNWLELRASNLTATPKEKMTTVRIPGKDGGIQQFGGTDNFIFTLDGILMTDVADKKRCLVDMVREGQPLFFKSQHFNMPVMISTLRFNDRGGRPDVLGVTLELEEYNGPDV